MPFPEVKRVLYRKSPLEQVVAQVRFPPILRIDAEIPAEFQEKVRKYFPNFSETSEWNFEFTQGPGEFPPELLRQVLQSAGNKNYEFSSEEGQWKINLTRTFVALTTKKYSRWEEFKEKLKIPLGAVTAIYSPNHFSRVGLRYIDVIRRSSLNLEGVEWNELLKSYVSGILAAPEVGNYVRNFESKYEIKLSDEESAVRIITKLVKAKDNSEICYTIDSDFSNSQKTEIASALERLDYFNARASRLIQWCITERLHNAMEPQLL
jgi:uncharacterized protein (TIGR04255 family)